MRAVRYAPFLLVVVFALVACGSAGSTGSATPTASQSATQSATTADVLAVANRVWFGPNSNPCSVQTVAQCPITARLVARMRVLERPNPSGTGPIEYWCRCQNVGNVSTTAEVTPTGGIAHVTFDQAIKVDFVIVEQSGNLLLDDTVCTGKTSATSIYVDPLVGCG